MRYKKTHVYRRPGAPPPKAPRPGRRPRWVRLAMGAAAGSAVLSLLAGGFSLARYVMDQHENTSAQAQNFYFASTQLSEPDPGETVGQQYSLVWWDPKTPLTLSLDARNFRDELNISPEELRYDLIVTDQSAVKLQDLLLIPEGGSPVNAASEVKLTGQVLGTGSTPSAPLKATHSYALTLTAPNFDQATYQVRVQAISRLPYEKSLTAEYTIVVANGDTALSVTDQKGYLAATLWLSLKSNIRGAGETSRITLTYPEGVVPDMTNPWLQAADVVFDPDARTLTAAFPTGGTTEIYFFKTNEMANFSGGAGFTAQVAAPPAG